VIFGPDPRGLILTAIAVLLSEWIFLADVVDPWSKHPILTSAFTTALAAAVSFTTMNV
jgi:palmitoyltransferase ZDHHC9/14/18